MFSRIASQGSRVGLLFTSVLLLSSSPAHAADSCFRLIDAPQCTAKGLALTLCFAANWGSAERSKAANQGVEFAVYPAPPDPCAIRSRSRPAFLVTEVPDAGNLKMVIPFDALKTVAAAPGKTIALTAHWANAMAGGAPATHVWGYTSTPVPLPIPADFVLPGAKQNAALGVRDQGGVLAAAPRPIYPPGTPLVGGKPLPRRLPGVGIYLPQQLPPAPGAVTGPLRLGGRAPGGAHQ